MMENKNILNDAELFESFEEIEDIVTAADWGTLGCCPNN